MNCQEYWDNLPQRGHEITEAQSAHVAECPNCAAQSEAHRALAAGLRWMGDESRQTEAPPRVEVGLLAAYRLQAGRQMRPALVRRSWWTPVFAWASAAAAMVALAVVLTHGYQPGYAKPTVASPHHTAQPQVQTAALSSMDADSDDDSATLGEGFVRLPNAAPIEPDEETYVVRVEAPVSDLIASGLPMSEEHASETRQADLLYGSDGTPRAVRLVSDGGTY
jgi:hypothetical protein